jgi:hypothetical protein
MTLHTDLHDMSPSIRSRIFREQFDHIGEILSQQASLHDSAESQLITSVIPYIQGVLGLRIISDVEARFIPSTDSEVDVMKEEHP